MSKLPALSEAYAMNRPSGRPRHIRLQARPERETCQGSLDGRSCFEGPHRLWVDCESPTTHR